MKRRVFSVVTALLLIVVFLSGCGGFKPLTGGPSLNADVTSNGGLSVQKGNYLYFVNGFKNSESLVDGDNKYGEVQNAGIYRAELNSNNELLKDEEGNLLNVELLIPKVVGFEKGGLYIFDNYIFYASPTILKDRTGEVRFDLVDFYLAKLDGSGVEKIYATDEYSDIATFSFYKIDNSVYLVVYDGTSIVSVKITNGKVGTVTKMVEKATSVAFPSVLEYNSENYTVQDINKYIYYTRELNNEIDGTILDMGNVLAKVEIGKNIEDKLIQDNVWGYSLNYVKNGGLYYMKYSSGSLNSKLYYRSLNGLDIANNEEIQLSGTYYNSVLPLNFEGGENKGIVVATDSQLIYVSDVFVETGMTLLVNEKVTPLFIINGYVYYTYGSKNTLARVNILNVADKADLTSEEDEFKVDVKLKADYDNEYIYLYKKHSNENFSSYYLERIHYMTSSFTSEFIGVMEEIHLPDEETSVE